jgi:hypothetical protein
MNTRQQFLSFTFLLLTSTSIFGEAQCPGNVPPVRYHSLGNSQIAIDVSINHAGVYEFMVDTGSQITIIEPPLAAELNMTPVANASLVSDVRHALVEVVRLDVVEVGRFSVEHSLAAVQSLAQIQSANPKVRGILGEDFLMHFDLMIDHGHGIVCLDATGEMQKNLRGERIALVMKPDAEWGSPVPQPLLIQVQLGEKLHNRILRLDSGANVPQLYVNTLETAPWVQRQNALRGRVTGEAAEYFALMPQQDIRIGKYVVRDVVFATPLKNRQNVRLKGEDGLLPTTLFKRVLICYADHFVVVNTK